MSTCPRVDELKQYTRIDNLIFKGLPESSFSEAASQVQNAVERSVVNGKSSDSTMAAIISVNTLHVEVSVDDISTTNRMPKATAEKYRPIIDDLQLDEPEIVSTMQGRFSVNWTRKKHSMALSTLEFSSTSI